MLSVVAAILDNPSDLGLPQTAADDSALSTVLTIVFSVAAVVSFVMIAVGGFQYVISHGNPNSISRAKNTLLYAIIGLLVSLVAFSIVRFVIGGVS